jgi:hypothetical protein
MRKIAFFLATLALGGVSTGPEARGGELGDYLVDREGRKVLKEPLTLREQQEGIAGKTGTVWTVEPSGRWHVSRFRSEKDGERSTPLRSGTLSASELETLAKVLAAQDLAGLPEKTGTAPKVNGRLVTLKFGGKSATLAGLPPRRNQPLAENIRKGIEAKKPEDSGPWERFAHLSHAVETSCSAAAKP